MPEAERHTDILTKCWNV